MLFAAKLKFPSRWSCRCQRLALCVGILASYSAWVSTTVEAQESPSLDQDTSVIEFILPPGATLEFGGRDYGEKRKLTYRNLTPGQRFPAEAVVRFTSGEEIRRTIWFWGGQYIRVPLRDPAEKLPRAVLQQGHVENVNSVAFSNDGAYCLTSAADRSAILWEPHGDWPMSRVFTDFDSFATFGDVSPDGELIAISAWNSQVELYRRSSGQTVASFDVGDDNPMSVKFSPDGRLLLCGTNNGQAFVWDVASRRKLRTLNAPQGSIYYATFSPDGRRILTVGGVWGDDDTEATGEAILWDVTSGRMLRRLSGHADFIKAGAFSPDGRWIVTGSVDSNVVLRDAATGNTIRALERHAGQVTAAAFSPNSDLLVTVGGTDDDPEVMFWDPETGELVFENVGHWKTVNFVAFHPSGDFIVSSGRDGLLMMWDPATGSVISAVGHRAYTIQQISVTSERFQILARSADYTVPCLWEAVTGRPLQLFDRFWDEVNAMVVSQDGTMVMTGGDENVALWSVETGEVLHELEAHQEFVFSVAISADGRLAASGGSVPDDASEAELYLWDVQTGKMRFRLRGQPSLVNRLKFDPSGSRLLVGGLDGQATLWDTTTGRKLATFGDHDDWVTAIAWHPSGSRILTGSRDGVIKLWEVGQRNPLATWTEHEGAVNDLAFSPDGKLAVSGSEDGVLRIREVATGKVIREIAHRLPVQAIAIDPTTRLAMAGFWDGSVSVIDVAAGAQIARVLLLHEGDDWLCFSPEGLCDGSFWGWQSVLWVQPDSHKLLATDELPEQRYYPGLLHDLIAGLRPSPTSSQSEGAAQLEVTAIANATEGQGDPTESSPTPALVPEDTTIVDLTLPPSAHVRLLGQEFAAPAGLEIRRLQPGRRYDVELSVTFANQTTETHRLLLEGGRRIRLSIPDPRQTRPEMVLQTAHRGAINWTEISPDGKYALTTSQDDTALLWNVESGQTLRVFNDHTDFVSEAVFSPDGSQVMTCSFDGTAIMYDIATGEIIHVFADHIGSVITTSFSHDGRYVVTGADDGTAIVYQVSNGQRLRTFRLPEGEVWAARFSPDGQYLIAGGGLLETAAEASQAVADLLSNQMGEVCVWEFESGQLLVHFQEHKGPVADVVVGANGRHVASAGYDGAAIVWELTTGEVIHTILDENATANSNDFSADGRYLIVVGKGESSADDSGTAPRMELWDTTTWQRIRTFEGHQAAVASVRFGPQAKTILTGAYDGEAILWDTESGEILRRFKGYPGQVSPIQVGHDRFQLLVHESNSDHVALWDGIHGRRVLKLSANNGSTNASTLSDDGRYVAIGTSEGQLTLHNVTDGKPLFTIQAHPHLVADICFSADGRRIATAGGKIWRTRAHMVPCDVAIWEVPSGKLYKRYSGHESPVISLALSADGRLIAGGGEDQRVIVWDVASGRQLLTLVGHGDDITTLAFSPDRRLLVSGDANGQMTVWDLSSGRKLRDMNVHRGQVYYVAFSPSGEELLSGSADGKAIIWNVRRWQPVRTFTDDDHVTYARLSDDGSRLLTGLFDATATIWDVATGAKLAKVVLLSEAEQWVVVTPEGLFDGSKDGRQRVNWRIGKQLQVVPVDRFFQDFYRPGLLNEVFAGLRPLPTVELGQSLPPQIRLIEPQSGAINERQATIVVEAEDQGGGINRLTIYQNGARILADGQQTKTANGIRQTFRVFLIEGENRFRITATSSDGSWEAEPVEVVLRYEQSLPKSDLYVLTVGINQYADNNLRLNFASTDAQALAGLFQRRAGALYENVYVTQIVDAEATRESIREAVQRLAAATKPQDTLVVFLAGHGIMVGQRYYFVPHDFRKQKSRLDDDLRDQGFPADELADILATAQALKRLLILDTCASGGALTAGFHGRSGFALRGAIERLSRTQGVFTIAASAASEEAQESELLGHGVLTYALLAGLNAVEGGPLDSMPIPASGSQPVVDVLSWFSYASGHVPQLTEELFGVAQDVHTSAQGTSFPVLPLLE